jgi:CubicO group peptidase (beta-lactamase class C family)
MAGWAAGSVEPDEAQLRAAMQDYLSGRDVGPVADRPRYLNATRIHRFEKRECRPATPQPGFICGYLLETGTTYREVRISSHRFEPVEGRWVSRGPVRGTGRSSIADAGGAGSELDAVLEEKRRLVRQAETDDLAFWQRYLRRIESPGEFPQPEAFYTPGLLIEGGLAAPLPASAPRQRLVDAARWQAALGWARSHETEALLVARRGAIEHAYFAPGREAGDLLPVRSIAKGLVAIAVGAAIADGFIESERTPIGALLPSWRDDPRGRITIEQLLTMSSGLDSYRPDRAPLGRTLQLAEGSDVAATALSFPLLATPGSKYGWGNVESQLLAMALENATGQSYRDYLEARIWKPMGLGTATLNADARGQARAFCCLRIRADDLLKIGLMLLDGGQWQGRQILPTRWVERMFAPSALNPYHGYQGFIGWSGDGPRRADPPLIVRQDVPFAEPAWYLTGLGGTTALWMLPCSGLVVFRWGNDPPRWEASAIPNLLRTGELVPERGTAPARRGAEPPQPWRAMCRS